MQKQLKHAVRNFNDLMEEIKPFIKSKPLDGQVSTVGKWTVESDCYEI